MHCHNNRESLSFKSVFVGGDKFDDYMFWLLPFYHELFPSMDKLIVIDADTGKYNLWIHHLQGDHSGCVKPPVDNNTKVAV